MAQSPSTSTGPEALALALVFLALALFLGSTGSAFGADFILRDGKRMEGDVLYASRSAIVIRSSSGAVEQLSRRAVDRVAIKTRKHGILVGGLEHWADGTYEIRTEDKIYSVKDRRVISNRPVTAAASSGEEPASANKQGRTDKTPASATEEPAAAGETAAEQPKDAGSKRLPRVIVSSVEQKEDAAELVFKLSLSESVAEDVLLIYATADGTARGEADYKTQRGAVILRAGSEGTKVSIPLLDDDLAEGNETFELLVTSDLEHEAVKVQRGLATILDNETAPVSQ